MTGDGVFFAQTWHKSNLPPTRALFFPSAGTSAGARNSLSSFPQRAQPQVQAVSSFRGACFCLLLPPTTKSIHCRAGLINGLLACCRKPCLNYVNGHPTGTMIQNPMARYFTLMYRLQCIKIVVRSADEGRQARWAGSADVVNHQTDGKYVYCEVQYLMYVRAGKQAEPCSSFSENGFVGAA